ncbi:hypothetical protein GUITHDRAFT_164066 [Guillardia theta CCMP2712]|uniref:Uncharacterized protein n=1 Tax=Guillardia theta (strain CCMP2712) TaxID=905079 RepID=L1J290_GUITC|nr:hypothetical protein GUITHDRAFT_164066 [Guillardia theta CCMP2712]EKX42643.1 hypothetical protein GUITHDRAFT_164066 [Guillardia theta CCMP2712]|eukprot:XP_005829623.1 hypothetical protein GUITHDRAFT_164066 [Guillardia theta CCMP2712]
MAQEACSAVKEALREHGGSSPSLEMLRLSKVEDSTKSSTELWRSMHDMMVLLIDPEVSCSQLDILWSKVCMNKKKQTKVAVVTTLAALGYPRLHELYRIAASESFECKSRELLVAWGWMIARGNFLGNATGERRTVRRLGPDQEGNFSVNRRCDGVRSRSRSALMSFNLLQFDCRKLFIRQMHLDRLVCNFLHRTKMKQATTLGEILKLCEKKVKKGSSRPDAESRKKFLLFYSWLSNAAMHSDHERSRIDLEAFTQQPPCQLLSDLRSLLVSLGPTVVQLRNKIAVSSTHTRSSAVSSTVRKSFRPSGGNSLESHREVCRCLGASPLLVTESKSVDCMHLLSSFVGEDKAISGKPLERKEPVEEATMESLREMRSFATTIEKKMGVSWMRL